MNYAIRKPIRALCLFPLAAVWLACATVQAQTALPEAASATAPAEMHRSTMGSADMKQSMKSGMDSMQQMQMSGDTDRDFAMMMKMHHEQALDMARMELEYGKSPELKAMATKIISAQKKEIAQFDRWLAKQK